MILEEKQAAGLCNGRSADSRVSATIPYYVDYYVVSTTTTAMGRMFQEAHNGVSIERP